MISRDLTFDPSAHSLDAVQRAIYRLSDRLACDLDVQDGRIKCTVHMDCDDESEAEARLFQLRNEVLDYALRERIRLETQEVRNVILALAFSNTGLVESAEG